MVMNMNPIKNYLNKAPFKIIIEEKKLYIANYKRLISLEDNYISLVTSNKKIIIKGIKLSLKKIEEEELLVEGTIQDVEVLDEI